MDPGYRVLKVIRDKDPRLVVHVRLQGRECLLKVLKESFPWKRPGRHLRFQKEIFIYSMLQHICFSRFRYPKLLNTDNKNYILTEFIINNSANRQDQVFYTSAMNAVLEFNTCDFPFHEKSCAGWIWEKTNRWKFSRSAKTLRNLLEGSLVKGKLSFLLLIKIIGFWRRAITYTPALKKPLLVHRDIFKANILYPKPGKIYFVDFEKAGLEKRWLFIDALKIAQAEPLFFNRRAGRLSGFPRFYACLLQKYWKGLITRRPEISPEYNQFILQLKFCLIGWCLKKLFKEDSDPERSAALIRFLQEVITGPEHYFEYWFEGLPRLPKP